LNPEKPHGDKIEIARLNGRLFLPPQQMYLAYADADVFGLHVSASGRLIHPQAFRHLSANSGQALTPDVVARIVETIRAIKFEGDPPSLSVTFSGDLAEPEQIFVELAFWAERLRREHYALKNLYIGASYRAGILDLKQLVATDAVGELRLSGWWDPAMQHAQLQLRSGIDAAGLARACGQIPWLEDMVFYAPPSVTLRVDETFGEKPAFLATGEVTTGKFAYRSVVFEHAEGGFSWDGKQWSLREVRISRGTNESLEGDALQVNGEFHARLTSTINPKAFQPLVTDRLAEALRQLEFALPPRLTLEARGLSLDVDSLRVDGEVFVGAGSFRGVPAESAHATVHFENRVLSLEPFHIKRAEGDGYGNVYIDFRRDEVRFDKVRARVNPPEMAMWVDPNLVSSILPYRFGRKPPNLLIDGVVQVDGGSSTQLVIDVDAPTGLDYTFLNKSISFQNVSGKLLVTNERLWVSNVAAGLFGGSISGAGEVSLVRNDPGYQAQLSWNNVNFGGFARLYFGTEGAHGRFRGRVDFTGAGDDPAKTDGQGSLALEDGDVLRVPFLAPFSGILDQLAAGLGHEFTGRTSASFKIAHGVASTTDFVARSKSCSLRGRGAISLGADHAKFDLQIAPQGWPGVLLSPLTQVLEFRTDQQFSQPDWRLRVMPLN
jgi:hypothetical protein